MKVPFLWVEGMALFPFILVKNSRIQSKVLRNHECIHLAQQLEMGLIFFYLWYVVEYLVRLVWYLNHEKAYYMISFEKEAYQNESDREYLKKRRFWAFLKYL